MKELSNQQLQEKIFELEGRIEEYEQLMDAIKAGEVDAFAMHHGEQSEIFTLQSGDYVYRLLVENFNEGALNITQEGLIVYTNRYFHELLDLPYEKVIGNDIREFLHEDSVALFNELFQKGISGQSKGEIKLKTPEKSIPVYISLTSLMPTLLTVGMIVSDLSELKKQEQLVEEKNKELLSTNNELMLSNKELASFAYIASHDLQEPLRKIRTFASRIVDQEGNSLTENSKVQFERMQHAAHRMQMLIEDLLSYSRTNTLEKKFALTDLNFVIEQVKEDLGDELLDKKASVESSTLGSANVIPFQFHQLIYNLISNSLKFAKPETPPRIRINGRLVDGSSLNIDKIQAGHEYYHISVSDNGIGFEPQYSVKIFDLFQRLHGNTQYNGTGIGLAIVKKIVENHNGHIVASSELNEGAVFDIYIPMNVTNVSV